MPAVHFPLLLELLRMLQKYLLLLLLKGKIMVEIWTAKTVSKLRDNHLLDYFSFIKGMGGVFWFAFCLGFFLRAQEEDQYCFYVRIKASLLMG